MPAPASANGPAPLPAPGSPAPEPAPAPAPAAPAPPAADPADELRAALAAERRDRLAVQQELDKLRQQGMTEQERAVAAAKDEGRKEASKAAGIKVAMAEFRALAAGRLADAAKMLEDGDLNLARFVDDDGNVDSKALGKLVDRLAAAAAPATAPGPGVPPGPRGAPPEGDFLRAAMSSHPRIS
jgi:hypothetical protein